MQSLGLKSAPLQKSWTHTLSLGKLPCSPERHRGDLAHEGVGRDALQVEQHAVRQQQQHDVPAVTEAPPAPADHRQVLWSEQKQRSAVAVFPSQSTSGKPGVTGTQSPGPTS